MMNDAAIDLARFLQRTNAAEDETGQISKETKLLVQRVLAFAILSSPALQNGLRTESADFDEAIRLMRAQGSPTQFGKGLQQLLGGLKFSPPVVGDLNVTMNRSKYLGLLALADEDDNYTGVGCLALIADIQKMLTV